MSDFLANATSWLAGVASDQMATLVTYRRGAATIEDLPATRGKTDFTEEDRDGITRTAQTTDFIIKRSLLVLDEVAIKPAEGDEILVADGDQTAVFRVLPTGGSRQGNSGSPAWRYADPHRTMYRIHVKQMSTQ